jgi:hypothetical protein
MLRNCKMACARFRSLVGAVIVAFLTGRLRVHFLCLPKENEPKEKAPDDLPAARVHSAHPCASPFGQPSAVRIGYPADSSLRFSEPVGVLRRDILVPRRTRRIHAAPLMG